MAGFINDHTKVILLCSSIVLDGSSFPWMHLQFKNAIPKPKGMGWEVVVTDYPLEYNCADITFQFIFCHYQQSLKTILSFKQKY